jgi:hypothetical protein
MRDVIYVVPPSFAARNHAASNMLTGCSRAFLLKFSLPVQKGWAQIKKLHRFTAATGSLKHFLTAVFVITFLI